MLSRLINLVGKKFGRLTVLERVEKGSIHSYWKCRCDCGNVIDVRGSCLREKQTKSCGCFRREASSDRAKRRQSHGLSKSKIWNVWQAIKMRCFNKNHFSYKNYGGRGITICEEWCNDIQSFFDYVSKLEHFGEDGYSLDRINNDGNYEPGNVRWATAKEQAINRRTTLKHT